jgi:hypothetical protein
LKRDVTNYMLRRKEHGPMGSGMKFKAKCNICGKKKLIGEGKCEAEFCMTGSIQFYPKRLMCAQCREEITKAAIRAVVQRVLIIDERENG